VSSSIVGALYDDPGSYIGKWSAIAQRRTQTE